jgi:hypothetical protein
MLQELTNRMLAEPLRAFARRFLAFLPNLVTAAFVVGTGALLGMAVGWLTARLLRLLGLDRHCEREGIREALSRGGIREPASALLGRLTGWLTALAFLIIALDTLQVPTVERVLERFLLYLPNLFLALGIVAAGWLTGNFLGRAALIAAVNARLGAARLLGNSVRGLVFLFSATMALEQLGIGRETAVGTFLIVLGGLVLALALAFGLGGRHLARRYLEVRIRAREEDVLRHL